MPPCGGIFIRDSVATLFGAPRDLRREAHLDREVVIHCDSFRVDPITAVSFRTHFDLSSRPSILFHPHQRPPRHSRKKLERNPLAEGPAAAYGGGAGLCRPGLDEFNVALQRHRSFEPEQCTRFNRPMSRGLSPRRRHRTRQPHRLRFSVCPRSLCLSRRAKQWFDPSLRGS